jgi:methylmalonyl-CoA mutase
MSYNPGKKLFAEFPPASSGDWEDLIRKDLKGADYQKKLIRQTLEGIPLRPYYTAGDLEGLEHLKSHPRENPFLRGRKISGDWLVRQDIHVDDVTIANSMAIGALLKGAASIGFILDDNRTFSAEDINLLLKDICLDSAQINFRIQNLPPGLSVFLEDENNPVTGHASRLHGSIEYDPLGALFLTGDYPGGDEQRSFDAAVSLVEKSSRLPDFNVVNVNASVFHNAGGSAVQELAFAMASGSEYLERMDARGIPAGRSAEKIRFTFAVGSNYFMEIAKLRAARYLWSRVLEAWEVDVHSAAKMFIHSVTSDWNKTIYDPYVNMLRSTTEAMSAILGGTDSLTVDRFNKSFRKEGTPFSERIARNTQLILKEEAYLDKVADPAAGSYYIESLTGSLIGESWKLFLETVDSGGIHKAFLNGFVQDKIEDTAGERDRHIAGRRIILLGTNQYPDASERAKDKTDIPREWPAQETNISRARPLKLYRGARAFEQLRFKTENLAGGPPKVFLLTYGNMATRKARAGFSAGFFGCAGFEIIDNNGFDNPVDGVKAAVEKKASIVVICSSDDEYPLIVPAIMAELRGKAIPVIAGYPEKSLEALKEEGVKHFIHIKSNILETLRQFQHELGIL